MFALRLSRRTAAFVLAWFLVFVATAGIAPWVQAQPMQDLCTSEGTTPAPQDGGLGVHASHHLECALCTGVSGPLPSLPALPVSSDSLGYALQPFVAAEVAAATGAPLPARGPPSLS